MLRRLRRPALLVLPAVLAASLTACGDDEGGGGASGGELQRLEAVEVSGEVGEAVEVDWQGRMQATDVETETLVEGEGEEIEDGDQVVTHIWIGNGYTETEAYSTYDTGQPETVTVSGDLSPVFAEAFEGQTLGSRVAVTASADEAFGEAGNPQLNIANKDSVLVIMDLVEEYQEPEPKDVPPARLPGIEVGPQGDPVALDFSGVPKPEADGELLRHVLREGKGQRISKTSTVEADYLGMVHGAKKPFDESYSAEPVEFSLTGVVPGWTHGLAGLKVGSRVLLSIPPDLGYGDQAQSGIPAGSTLYFVVDIVSAK